ncbi:small subunit ribosomal protein S26e [Sarotherodon galilaeus]
MDGVHAFLVVLLDLRNASVIEMRVRPGENITLYCDCKSSFGVYIVWYRNCSHEKQPSGIKHLVLKTRLDLRYRVPHSDYGSTLFHLLNPFPDFHLVKNNFSQSHDLLITNITETDEGLYYCGTEQLKVKDEEKIIQEHVRTYSNITTKIVLHKDFDSTESSPCSDSYVSSVVSRMMVLTPACSIFLSFISFVFVYQLCEKTEKGLKIHQKITRQCEDEDLCLTQVWFQAQNGHKNL